MPLLKHSARVFLVSFLALTIGVQTCSGTSQESVRDSFRIVVVGDTGIGDDAFNEALGSRGQKFSQWRNV